VCWLLYLVPLHRVPRDKPTPVSGCWLYYINYFISVGFEVLTAVVMKSIIFWNITPCSPLRVNRRFGGTYRLHLQAPLATCFHAGFLAYFSTLKMEAICSSEKSVGSQLTTRRYIPEDGTLFLY
jgi:hypothetical protein